jgi:hypothetical protein
MGARDDFLALVHNTEVMKHLLQLMEQEPFRIFTAICKEYEHTGKPVSDHHIPHSTYVGELALKALVAAGLVEQQPGGRVSLYQYKPTDQGVTTYKNLVAEGTAPK